MDGVLKVFLVISMLTQSYTAPRHPRLSLAENVPYHIYNNFQGTPETYAFGYDVADPLTGNSQYRSEERHANGTVTGSYGYVDAYGKPIKFKYIADTYGYRVYSDVTTPRPMVMPLVNEPTESSITWTRPPNRRKVFTDLVSQLGTLFTKNNFI